MRCPRPRLDRAAWSRGRAAGRDTNCFLGGLGCVGHAIEALDLHSSHQCAHMTRERGSRTYHRQVFPLPKIRARFQIAALPLPAVGLLLTFPPFSALAGTMSGDDSYFASSPPDRPAILRGYDKRGTPCPHVSGGANSRRIPGSLISRWSDVKMASPCEIR